MQINATNEESTAAVLCSGLQTYVLNTITNLQATISELQRQLDREREVNKTLEAEVQKHIAELDNQKEESELVRK